MSDGNYNDLHRARSSLHLARHQLDAARQKGQPTAMLERNVQALETRLEHYEQRG